MPLYGALPLHLIIYGIPFGLLLLLLIGFLIRSLSVERRRKHEALHSLRYEHETLAILPSVEVPHTYGVWKGEGIISRRALL
ncbi:MAG: hypothetical protein ACLUHA_06825 [Bacteroides stercoris]